MAATAESQMNLAALQQRDPYITEIVDTASQVALYSFNPKANEWEKTAIEGTLFVYTRSARPINGFMILNRLGLNDLIEPINRNLEFQLQDPFLLYRNAQGVIHGIWFYDKDECARIGQLMNSLVQVSSEYEDQECVIGGRQRRASESDTLLEPKVMGKSSSGAAVGNAGASNVDILQMLYKAQDEYDKSKSEPVKGNSETPAGDGTAPLPAPKGKRDLAPPKPMINNPNAAATKSNNDLIRPLARKASPSQEDAEVGAGAQSISLETLFRRATMQQDGMGNPTHSDSVSAGGAASSQMPPLLQRLMSNPGGGTTVEEVERQHRLPPTSSSNRDLMPQPAGAENPPLPSIKSSSSSKQPPPPATVPYSSGGAYCSGPVPDSPNTAIKRSLNMTVSSRSSQSTALTTSHSASYMQTSTNNRHSPRASLVDVSMPLGQPRPVTAGLAAGPALTPAITRGNSSLTAAAVPLLQTMTGSQGMLDISSSSSCDSSSLLPMGAVRVGAGPGADTLITPQALLQSDLLASHQVSSSGIEASGLGVLLSPMAFQGLPTRVVSPPAANLNLPPPNTGRPSFAESDKSTETAVGNENISAPVNPLTRSQLQQALMHMLKHDDSFLDSLHDAYVESLHQSLQSRSNRL